MAKTNSDHLELIVATLSMLSACFALTLLRCQTCTNVDKQLRPVLRMPCIASGNSRSEIKVSDAKRFKTKPWLFNSTKSSRLAKRALIWRMCRVLATDIINLTGERSKSTILPRIHGTAYHPSFSRTRIELSLEHQ